MSPLLRVSLVTVWFSLLFQSPIVADSADGAQLDAALADIQRIVEQPIADFANFDADELARQTALVDTLVADLALPTRNPTPESVLARLDRMLDAKARADQTLEQLLERRTQFVDLTPPELQIASASGYLKSCQLLIDLSGRLRYTLRDAIDATAYELSPSPPHTEQLLDLLADNKSEIGALVTTPLLFAPAVDDTGRLLTHADDHRARVLRLISSSGCADALPHVARFLHERASSDLLLLLAAQTVRDIGLPQDPRPDQDPELPLPEITARQLHDILAKIDPSGLSSEQAQTRAELLAWLDRRRREGVTEDTFRIGAYDVCPGDWLLMRNPSPYNRFTNLSPGLFTHVGVVTAETGTDGIRRIIIVDLPERGTSMPATNVEIFLRRTLHYAFLRHDDPQCGQIMGRVANSVIGNETRFDLNFRTDRVRDLKGKPLAGEPIHTYCAGLLLLCAQETPAPREDYFPLPEAVAAGRTADNLQKLGLSIGEDFVSPTGAIFAPQLQIVGRREPMYEPTRDIEESIFDHFAVSLETNELFPSNTWYQSLRLRLAQAAQVTPLLGRALAHANDISPETDLVAAARAAAVVETLDEIAFGASADFVDARNAIRAGSLDNLRAQGASHEDLQRASELRRRHADLYDRWQRRQLSPRQLRIELADYYSHQGQQQLNTRFFHGD